MKLKAKAGMGFFLALVMLLQMLPATAWAANGEAVLTSINHSSALSAVVVSKSKTATITVADDYPYESVDLSRGLDISYNRSVYAYASAGFYSDSFAEVDGDPVSMTVTYQKVNDKNLYTTEYDVSVVRADGVAPSFTGTIAKTVKKGSLTFQASDFTSKYSGNDGGSLEAIAITGSNPGFGSLKLGRHDYEFGEAVSIDEIEEGELTFAAKGQGTVSYIVKAYASDDSDTAIGSVTLKITSKSNSSNSDPEDLAYETDKNTPVTFREDDFADVFYDATGSELDYVMFTLPSSAKGKLYYDYEDAKDYDSKVSEDTEYYVDELSDITFVPAANYTGTVTISYTGYNEEDDSWSGKIKISINGSGWNRDDDWDKNDGRNKDNDSGYFCDVGPNFYWASGAIDYLYNKKIVTGRKPGYYIPQDNISRGDFILILCNAFNLNASFDSNFSDVRRGSYYYNAIGTAKKLGIGFGVGGRFDPDAPLTREDAMVLILRALQASDISLSSGSRNDLNPFSDSGFISDYATDAFSTLVKANIIQGNGQKLNPKGKVSRAEMAVMMYRLLNR